MLSLYWVDFLTISACPREYRCSVSLKRHSSLFTLTLEYFWCNQIEMCLLYSEQPCFLTFFKGSFSAVRVCRWKKNTLCLIFTFSHVKRRVIYKIISFLDLKNHRAKIELQTWWRDALYSYETYMCQLVLVCQYKARKIFQKSSASRSGWVSRHGYLQSSTVMK